VLAEDWSLTLPADTVRAMAHHVAVQAGRLLASGHADQLVHDVRGCVATARRLTSPSRRQPIRVACPDCGERVALSTDPDEAVRCRGCGTWGVLAWWREQLVPDLDAPMTLRDASDWLLVHHGRDVPLETLRTWSKRADGQGNALLVEVGRDNQGRKLFDPLAVAELASRMAGGSRSRGDTLTRGA
jgi:ribosomal protein S27E